MFRQKVVVQDAIVAITLIESSILSTSFFGQIDTLHTTFPANPTAEYLEQGMYYTHVDRKGTRSRLDHSKGTGATFYVQ